nr:nitrogen fixation protein NifM [uncultured Cohaesibacter sp.]
MKEDMLLAYHLMSASLAAHGCRFDELPPFAQRPIKAQCERAILMESLVLASEPAQTVVIPDKLLEEALANITARYASLEDFRADLECNGLTEDGLKQALAKELAADATLEHVAQNAPAATEEEARSWYEAHPERFTLDETREARHILITVNDDIEENRREASYARIMAIARELDASLEQFADMALRHSECPSALNGGTLGMVPRGKLYPELDEALFEMDAGGISSVLESEAGFHILYCEAIHPARMAQFEDAAQKIRAAMDKKRRSERQKAFIGELLKHHGADRRAG